MTPPAPKAKRGMYPSIPAIIFAVWTIAVPLGFGHRLLHADGDLLRHIRHGEWMLAHHSLVYVDPFSYTMAGKPFVGFEYLSQLIFALVYRVGGFAAVVIFSGLLIGTSYAILARFLLARRVDPLLTYLLCVAAAVLGAIHWAARPHLFTLLGVVLLLHFLEPGDRRLPVWRIIPLFILWANLHAGFVLGLVLLGIYFVGSMLEWRVSGTPAHWAGMIRYYGALLVAATLATFVHPRGYELHRYIIRFFGEPFLRNNTQEFLSPDFHTAIGKLFLIALLVVVAVLALVPTRPTWPRLLLFLANVAFALEAQRNIPLFAITVFATLALQYDAIWRALPDWLGLRAVFERDARRGVHAPTIVPVVVLLATAALLHGRVGQSQLVPDRLDSKEFPVDAVTWGKRHGIEGRIFHEFTWGGYLLYAWPEQRIFIDGNTDFYGPALMRTYIDVISLRPGWRETLARWDVAFVLMPSQSSMVAELIQDGTWSVRYRDRTAAFLERRNNHPDNAQIPNAPTTAP